MFQDNEELAAFKQKADDIRRPGMKPEELMEAYAKRELSEDMSYEKRAIKGGYTAPRVTADRMASMVEIVDRKEYKILDVGAGTGFVGQELSRLGFRNIHALEPSDVLSKMAEAKNVYRRFYNCFMTEKETPGLQRDQFDGLTSCACFIENHLPVGALDEMVRVVRPGGVIVIEARLEYLSTVESYKDKLEPRMTELETLGKWTMKSRDVLPNFFADDDGVVWVFVVR